jgi:hypothetical protein
LATEAPTTTLTQRDIDNGTPPTEDALAIASAELDEARTHLLAIDRWSTLGLPPLTDDQREIVHEQLDVLCAERLARRGAHCERLASRAWFFGREVAMHRVLLKDAQNRLEAMALLPDPESLVPMLLVPHGEAIAIIEREFGASYRSARSELSILAVS